MNPHSMYVFTYPMLFLVVTSSRKLPHRLWPEGTRVFVLTKYKDPKMKELTGSGDIAKVGVVVGPCIPL